MMDDPSYFERECERCGDEAIGMSGLCHLCHESAEAKALVCECGQPAELVDRIDAEDTALCRQCWEKLEAESHAELMAVLAASKSKGA